MLVIDSSTVEFDYVIAGAGSAGCILANRLTADGRNRVLLLEAGGSDRRIWVRLPIGYGKCFHDGRVNWRYFTEPVETLNRRSIYWPRGRIVGGSSSINGLVYARGLARDFDDWEAAGAKGWSWNEVESSFKQLENWSGVPVAERGAGGPQSVADVSADVHPLCRDFIEACKEMGCPVTNDYNGERPEGAAIYQLTTRGGMRASAADCFLRPALSRHNLQLMARSHADLIAFEGNRATGVSFTRGSQTGFARAVKGVILSAGTVNSPMLLQSSGIGSAATLGSLGIRTIIDSPHVGRNLQDHLCVDLLYRSRVPTLNQVLRPWTGRARIALQYMLTRRGPLSLSVNQAGGFVRSRPELTHPDIQLYFSPVSYSTIPAGTRPLLRPDDFPGFLLSFNPCRPASTGSIEIRSCDPTDPPKIEPNYLASESDMQDMLSGLRFLMRMAGTSVLSRLIEMPIGHTGNETEDELRGLVRATATTVFHPCCTCRMGKSIRDSVVDHRLRVHGTRGLRVVDASVFPNITSGNTNAPTLMVAERAASMILEDDRQ